ncbi:MAG: hypothetical protein SWC40_03820 [Thermodesulfobacteriota bacterium]|nr:hypothetical protein [Thermodesulfobacteriota bacterium]
MDVSARMELEKVFRAGLAAVDPEAAVRRHLSRDGDVLLPTTFVDCLNILKKYGIDTRLPSAACKVDRGRLGRTPAPRGPT